MASKYIYLKINTVPATEEQNSKEFELFYDKYKQAKELGHHEDAFNQFLTDAHKHYLFGKIYSITVGSVYKDNENIEKIAVKVIKGQESDILKHFYNLYTEDFFKEAKSVVWRSEFILPFLSMRSIKNNIKAVGVDLQHFGKRVWNLSCFDLYEYLTGAGYFVPSLEEVAFMFNQPTDFIGNNDTYRFVKTGEENTVDESSVNEIKTLVNIHRILQQEEPLEEVNSNIYIVENVEVKELPLLEKLYQQNSFSAEIEKGLEKLLKKKKITVKDKIGIREILMGVYVRNDFENKDQDSKKVIAAKELEIDKFLQTL